MNLTKRNLIKGTRKTLGVIVSVLSLLIVGCSDNRVGAHYEELFFDIDGPIATSRSSFEEPWL